MGWPFLVGQAGLYRTSRCLRDIISYDLQGSPNNVTLTQRPLDLKIFELQQA